MANGKNSKRVSAVVPAHNEAERINNVLDVLTTYNDFREVIVVDDGSDDNTIDIVKKYGVKYVKLNQNNGKGTAMNKGVDIAKGDVIFFCDADIIGLNHKIISEIVNPVVENKFEMFIGMRNRKLYYLSWILSFIPLLGGERALTKKLWQKLPEHYKDKFKIETALNFYAKYYLNGFGYKVFPGLTQTIKEKKYGFKVGLKRRLMMISDVMKAVVRLQLVDIPKTTKNKRLIVFNFITNMSGFIAGALIFTAVYFGPVQLLLKIFRKELITDPNAPFVHLLLRLANNIGADLLFFIGLVIIALNLVFMLLNLRQILRVLNG